MRTADKLTSFKQIVLEGAISLYNILKLTLMSLDKKKKGEWSRETQRVVIVHFFLRTHGKQHE